MGLRVEARAHEATKFQAGLDLARDELLVVSLSLGYASSPVCVELATELLGAEVFGKSPEIGGFEGTLVAEDHDGGHPLEEDAVDEACIGKRNEAGIVEAVGWWKWRILGPPDLVPLFLVLSADKAADARVVLVAGLLIGGDGRLCGLVGGSDGAFGRLAVALVLGVVDDGGRRSGMCRGLDCSRRMRGWVGHRWVEEEVPDMVREPTMQTPDERGC